MKSLKLNQLSNAELDAVQMNQIKGGFALKCSCGCQYAKEGGSSISDNCDANDAGNKTAPKGVAVQCVGWCT